MNNLVESFEMPLFPGKRDTMIGAKVSQQEVGIYQVLCTEEDRSMSYMLRELAVRGLAHYLWDGRVKPTREEEEVIAAAINEGSFKLPVKANDPLTPIEAPQSTEPSKKGSSVKGKK